MHRIPPLAILIWFVFFYFYSITMDTLYLFIEWWKYNYNISFSNHFFHFKTSSICLPFSIPDASVIKPWWKIPISIIYLSSHSIISCVFFSYQRRLIWNLPGYIIKRMFQSVRPRVTLLIKLQSEKRKQKLRTTRIIYVIVIKGITLIDQKLINF